MQSIQITISHIHNISQCTEPFFHYPTTFWHQVKHRNKCLHVNRVSNFWKNYLLSFPIIRDLPHSKCAYYSCIKHVQIYIYIYICMCKCKYYCKPLIWTVKSYEPTSNIYHYERCYHSQTRLTSIFNFMFILRCLRLFGIVFVFKRQGCPCFHLSIFFSWQ